MKKYPNSSFIYIIAGSEIDGLPVNDIMKLYDGNGR
jgi:hypothetical protein